MVEHLKSLPQAVPSSIFRGGGQRLNGYPPKSRKTSSLGGFGRRQVFQTENSQVQAADINQTW